MTANYRGFPCPNCDAKMASLGTGRANEGQYMLRDRRCTECGHRRMTVEFAPEELVGYHDPRRFDADLMLASRQNERGRRGYHGITSAGHPRAPLQLRLRDGHARITGGHYLCDHPHTQEQAS